MMPVVRTPKLSLIGVIESSLHVDKSILSMLHNTPNGGYCTLYGTISCKKKVVENGSPQASYGKVKS